MGSCGGDAAAVALAGRQHGMVALRQLAAFGLGREWVRHRLAKGWLRRMHRGVYLVGPLESPLSRPMAAVLAAGDGAVLSHHSAAALWGLGPPRDEPVHVSVVDRDVRSRAGVRVHRSAIHPADITHRHGIRVTAPARTLLDLAPHLTQRDLDRAVEHAQIHHLASTHSLGEQFRRYPKHRGTAALRRATRSDPRLTRSEAERRLLELVRAARLPQPEVNRRLGGYEVDFHWPAARLIVEVDGYAFHSSRRSFERDRRRDAEFVNAGHRVIRFTWRQIDEEREAVAAVLATALSRG